MFRVNCMDCLDRTNVVESIISREVLQLAVSWGCGSNVEGTELLLVAFPTAPETRDDPV